MHGSPHSSTSDSLDMKSSAIFWRFVSLQPKLRRCGQDILLESYVFILKTQHNHIAIRIVYICINVWIKSSQCHSNPDEVALYSLIVPGWLVMVPLGLLPRWLLNCRSYRKNTFKQITLICYYKDDFCMRAYEHTRKDMGIVELSERNKYIYMRLKLWWD